MIQLKHDDDEGTVIHVTIDEDCYNGVASLIQIYINFLRGAGYEVPEEYDVV